MLRPVRRAISLAFAVVVVVGLSACAGVNEKLYGPAETDAQIAFQDKARYVHAAIPARNYVTAPDPQPSIAEAICAVDTIFYNASQGAAAAALAGSDDLTKIMLATASAVADVNLIVFENVVAPDLDRVKARSTVLVRVGAQSIAEMRLWRKGFVRVKARAFVELGRDPTPEEWETLDTRVEEIHGAIQAACGPPD